MRTRTATRRNRNMVSPFPLTCLIVLLAQLIGQLTVAVNDQERKMYIVYMGSHLPSGLSTKSFYDKMMTDALGSDYSEKPSEYLLHTYQRSFHGCVAKLTDAEAQKIEGMEGVVSIFPNEKMDLHTTRSWDFMGFPIHVPRSHIERDVIVGVIDTGIWPESPSFNDNGLGPVPAKWKGICQTAANFSCNKKIIGARFYKADKEFPENEGPTPRDIQGHGTHTASTVAGALVPKASFFGLASGTARGGVPSARIAVYKVCWTEGGCASADILSAFDDAIADGVDVISLSIGPSFARPYFSHASAIGSFHAMQRGILASLSAGNEGPIRETVGNTAPWLMSVAATTIDRKFLTNVQLGNGQVFQGEHSLNTFNLHGKNFQMIYGGDAPNSSFPSEASICSSLNRTLVQGKIVVCDPESPTEASQVTLDAGAAGSVMRFPSNSLQDGSYSFPLSTSIIGLNDGDKFLSYVRNLSRNPVGTILKSNTVKDKLAPYVASFSSRGPNTITPSILKPDLSAPGVDIIAAYSPKGEVLSSIAGDTRSVRYHIISGTSMACPHASATAAYVKSYHPDWSPAAIRSALMTTAFPLSPTINKDAELGYGAGHINPRRAVDPGLVYDAGEADYVNFLCNQGFSLSHIRQISGDNSTTCPKVLTRFVGDLNYPSITVTTNATSFSKIFQRRVKTVGDEPYPSVYNVKVSSPKGVIVEVVPETLRFTQHGQELSYTVRVKGRFRSLDEVISASIVWSDGVHKVRSPIVAFKLSK